MQPRRQLWQRHRHRLWLWKVAAGWKQLGQLASHAGVPDACPAAMAAAVAVAVASAKTIKSFFGCLTLIHIHVIWPTGAHSKWNLFLFCFWCATDPSAGLPLGELFLGYWRARRLLWSLLLFMMMEWPGYGPEFYSPSFDCGRLFVVHSCGIYEFLQLLLGHSLMKLCALQNA